MQQKKPPHKKTSIHNSNTYMFNKDYIQEQRLVYMHENTKNEHHTKYEHLPYSVEEPTAARIRVSLENHVKQLDEWKESKKLIEEFKVDFAQLSAEQQGRFYSLRQTYHDDVLRKIEESENYDGSLFEKIKVEETMRDILNGLLTLKYVKKHPEVLTVNYEKKDLPSNEKSVGQIQIGVSQVERGIESMQGDDETMKRLRSGSIVIVLNVEDNKNTCIVRSKENPNITEEVGDISAANFEEELKNAIKKVSDKLDDNPFKDDPLDDPLLDLPTEEARPDADRMGGQRSPESMPENVDMKNQARLKALLSRFSALTGDSVLKNVNGSIVLEEGGNTLKDFDFIALLDAFDDDAINTKASNAVLKNCTLSITIKPGSLPPEFSLLIRNKWGTTSTRVPFDPRSAEKKQELVIALQEAIQSVDEKHLLNEIMKEAKGTLQIEEGVDPGVLKILRSGLESRKMYDDEDGSHTGTQKPKPNLNLRISSTMIQVFQKNSAVTKPYDVKKLLEDDIEIQNFVITHCTEIVPKVML